MWITLLIFFDLGAESTIAPDDTRAHLPRLFQGSDFLGNFTVKIGTEPVDFSAFDTFTLRVVDPKTNTLIMTCGNECVTGDNQGGISIAIPASASNSLSLPNPTRTINGSPLNDLWYTLDAVNTPSNATIRICHGQFVIAQDVYPAI